MASRGHVFQRCPKVRPGEMGCPKPCKRHRWSYTVELPRVAGRRDQRTKGGFATRAEAQRALTALLASVDAGTAVPTRITVEEYLESWLQRKASSRKLKPTTLRSYRQHLDRYLIPALGDIKLQDLRPHHVDRAYTSFMESRSRNGACISASTLRRIHATLNSAMNAGVRRNEIVRNPAAHVELPRVLDSDRTTWSVAELHRFLESVEGERFGPLFQVASLLGLRRGEIAGLRWCDVDLETGTLDVRVQLVQVGHQVVEQDPKTKRGIRRLQIDSGLVRSLRQWKARQSAERLAWGAAYVDSGRVFTRENGESLHPETITKTFIRLVRASDLPRIRFHDLRHTSATLAIDAGEDVRLVMKRLGHSSIAVTVNMYTHDAPDAARDAAERLATLVRTASGD